MRLKNTPRSKIRIVSILIKIFVRAIPASILEILEMRVQQSMGKGWGAQSIEMEPILAIDQLKKNFPGIYNPIVFDVGANVGGWTQGALKDKDIRVVCFEPSRVAFEILTKKFAKNERVRLENVALGGSKRSANLYSDSPGSSLSSLSNRDLKHLDIQFNSIETVKVVTLESWCMANNVVPDILKLDVEGFEIEVLSGSGEILKEIKLIQMELGGCNIDTRTYFHDYWNILDPIGFSFLRLSPRGLIEIPKYSESLETFTTTNYFAINKRKANLGLFL